jgi:hypothetical protein
VWANQHAQQLPQWRNPADWWRVANAWNCCHSTAAMKQLKIERNNDCRLEKRKKWREKCQHEIAFLRFGFAFFFFFLLFVTRTETNSQIVARRAEFRFFVDFGTSLVVVVVVVAAAAPSALICER